MFSLWSFWHESADCSCKLSAVLRTIVFWFFVAGGLLNTPELQAEERYSWEQILAERRQLDDNSMTSLDKAIPEFELRIAAASHDPYVRPLCISNKQ